MTSEQWNEVLEELIESEYCLCGQKKEEKFPFCSYHMDKLSLGISHIFEFNPESTAGLFLEEELQKLGFKLRDVADYLSTRMRRCVHAYIRRNEKKLEGGF